MDEDIKKIIEYGVYAPSGGNSQPWKFGVKDNQIYIYAIPEKDHPILNFRNRGTYLAIGALTENIIIASTAFGYKSSINFCPKKENPNLLVIVNLEKSETKPDQLFDSIKKRATNRKPYKNNPLPLKQKEYLLETIREIGFGDLKIIDDPEKIDSISSAVSMNEVVMFENKKMHRLFFNEVVWSEEEEAKKKSGLYIKTLEMEPPKQIALRFFKFWPVMNFFNKLGLARSIAKENYRSYKSTGIFGGIIIRDEDKNFFEAGRAIERVWLKCTSLELSFHLITGIPFLFQSFRAGMLEDFSKDHLNIIKNSYENLVSAFEVQNGIIAVLFRAGDGGNPSARSSRLTPNISVEI